MSFYSFPQQISIHVIRLNIYRGLYYMQFLQYFYLFFMIVPFMEKCVLNSKSYTKKNKKEFIITLSLSLDQGFVEGKEKAREGNTPPI